MVRIGTENVTNLLSGIPDCLVPGEYFINSSLRSTHGWSFPPVPSCLLIVSQSDCSGPNSGSGTGGLVGPVQ